MSTWSEYERKKIWNEQGKGTTRSEHQEQTLGTTRSEHYEQTPISIKERGTH
jgi:hypothetical protein